MWFDEELTVYHPLPDIKVLGLPKLNAFADDKLNIAQNICVS